MRGRTGVRGKAAARGAVVIALVAAGVAAPSGAGMARSLFPIGCDETSDSDESALIAAVTSANDEAHHPCEDVIQLTYGCTYTFETPFSATYPRPALPEVDSTITVWGRNAVLHGPTALGACDACHVPADVTKNTFNIKKEGKALCNFCHVAKKSIDCGTSGFHTGFGVAARGWT